MDMPLTDQERETLLTVLLDTRYRFAAELAADAPSSSERFCEGTVCECMGNTVAHFKASSDRFGAPGQAAVRIHGECLRSLPHRMH